MHILETTLTIALLALFAGAQGHGGHQEKPTHTNRLAKEKSPYLRQHQHNPVDWWPWCEEAFAEAKKRGVPVFVSVGYSTCHWCHVMAHESFENDAIAAVMNRDYVNIKVDREERPDIDAIIQKYIQVMSRQGGGWPASVFLTSDKKPIYAGTYYPPTAMHGRPGFPDVLSGITKAWKEKAEQVLLTGTQINKVISDMAKTKPSKELPDVLLTISAADRFMQQHDEVNGGFGTAPKFPRTSAHDLLLAVSGRTGRDSYKKAAIQSLKAMANGGIYDHVGGGFHRYSTDPIWLVPHFEKMLYDEALIAQTYTSAWQAANDPDLAYTAQDTLDCVLRDFRHKSGGFMCAYDADSGGVEGSYYVWSQKELEKLFKSPTIDVLLSRFGIQTHGNWHELPGTNILSVEQSWADVAEELKKEPAEVRALWEAAREVLRTERDKRPRPGLDHKILAGWNGMTISALARAGFAFHRKDYILAAEEAATFVHTHLATKDGQLLRRWCEGEARYPGVLKDYAFVATGYLDLFEATGNEIWLTRSTALIEEMIDLFAAADGGFLDAPIGDLGIQTKEPYDGAVPSGNSAAIGCLLRLGDWLMRVDLTEHARFALRSFNKAIRKSPEAYPLMLMGLLGAHDGLSEVVIATAEGDDTLVESLRTTYLPLGVRIVGGNEKLSKLGKTIPLLKGKLAMDKKSVGYLCRRGVCQAPTTDGAVLKKSIADSLRQDPPTPEK